jgi:hypothetical protein
MTPTCVSLVPTSTTHLPTHTHTHSHSLSHSLSPASQLKLALHFTVWLASMSVESALRDRYGTLVPAVIDLIVNQLTCMCHTHEPRYRALLLPLAEVYACVRFFCPSTLPCPLSQSLTLTHDSQCLPTRVLRCCKHWRMCSHYSVHLPPCRLLHSAR